MVKDFTVIKQKELEMPPDIDVAKNSAVRGAWEDKEIEQEISQKYKVSKETKKMGIIKEKVREFAKENIEGTASLIKNYMVEE
jgi:flagellar biosynthesis/type III secretory pathway M-ring protein FliF/YscJ